MLINKKSVLIALPSILIAVLGVNLLSHSFSGSPNNAHTGSPGDGGTRCNTSGCHVGGTPAVQTNQTITFTTNVPDTGYTPGSTYTFNVIISGTNPINPTANEYGFEACVEKLSNNTKTGTLIATNTTQTQVSAGYIKHKSVSPNGTNNMKTYSFNWTAPVTGNGPVKIYAVANISNNANGDDAGDLIITNASDSIKEYIAPVVNGINTANASKINVYPNPATDVAYITIPNNLGTATINVYSLNGSLVHTQANTNGTATLNTENWAKGSYLISINGTYTAYGKLMVR